MVLNKCQATDPTCCLATLESVMSIAAALVMHRRCMQTGVLLVHFWCCRQAAVPFLVITRRMCWVSCSNTQHCSAAFAQLHLKSCPCSPTTSLNADSVLCLQVRSSLGLGIGGTPSSPFAESLTCGVASLSGAGSPISSSSVASHKSEVFSCLMEVSCVAATSGACRLCHGHASDVVC